jgi:hypothetical protein
MNATAQREVQAFAGGSLSQISAGKVELIGYWLPLGEKNPKDYVALGARLELDNKLIRRADDARMNQLEH